MHYKEKFKTIDAQNWDIYGKCSFLALFKK